MKSKCLLPALLSVHCILFFIIAPSYAQKPVRPTTANTYTPIIRDSACPIRIDSSFHTRCGYLVVPENRNKANGRTIRLPFILAESKNPHKKADPVLYSAGGPGGSSLGWINGAIKHSPILDRDCIAFEQRGTHYALPNLWSEELSDAIRESYRKNLDKDSMMLVGTRRYRQALEARGIDLAGYNTDETVADIADLLTVLHIDSVNLSGGSYGGGLMLAVLQKIPSRIRSLILDSPLPTFVPIDEDEPANFNEALQFLFRHVETDSTDTALYGHLQERFQNYFTSIGLRPFTIPYLEKGTTDTLQIQYTRNDLLEVIQGFLSNASTIKDVPYVITEIMRGHHQEYIRRRLDGIFRGGGPSGMRISVYCADQAAYHSEDVLHELYSAYPYMEGYHINDVYKAMCDCWPVPPIRATTKKPLYSAVPILLADGEMDNACRPLYIDMIHHYMPNSQRFLFVNRSHGVGGMEMDRLMKLFLDDPCRKIGSPDKSVIAY